MPLVTIVALQFGAVLTGAVITETIFAWPGIGRLLIQSIGFRDYPLVQGCILLIAVTYVTVNLMTDLLYGVLDPRIRSNERPVTSRHALSDASAWRAPARHRRRSSSLGASCRAVDVAVGSGGAGSAAAACRDRPGSTGSASTSSGATFSRACCWARASR